MKLYPSLKSILAEFFPLHRTLASDDHDKTLEIVGSYMPDSSNYTIETYAPLTPVWTWRVPERYVVHEAYLETEDGERIVDFKNNPLHIVSYSLPVDKTLSFEELQTHLYFNEKRPHTVPWVFKYYERDWGFCLPKNTFDKLPRDKKYRAVIKSEFILTLSRDSKLPPLLSTLKVDRILRRGSSWCRRIPVTPCKLMTTARG